MTLKTTGLSLLKVIGKVGAWAFETDQPIDCVAYLDWDLGCFVLELFIPLVSSQVRVAIMPSKSVPIPDDLEFDTNLFLLPGCYQNDLKSVIIPEGFVRDRVKQLAHEIHEAIGDKPLILLCVLKGSYRFFTTLADELSVARHQCKSAIKVDFIRTKSYEDTASSGKVQIIGLTNQDELKGQNVLIVEDIVDSGLTMSRLVHTLQDLGAKQVWTSVLLSKRITRQVEVPEDFVAFNIPDKFIVGYGLDYNQHFRDLNHICVMSEQGIAKYKSS
uniref:Hypoxanthine phosphoribosyltransferase n=1 Tax=Panagrellus redivivus TaxID=6233 RepID=A0A7E4ZUJ7_PANRE